MSEAEARIPIARADQISPVECGAVIGILPGDGIGSFYFHFTVEINKTRLVLSQCGGVAWSGAQAVRHAVHGPVQPIGASYIRSCAYNDHDQQGVDDHRSVADRRPVNFDSRPLAMFRRTGLSRIVHERRGFYAGFAI